MFRPYLRVLRVPGALITFCATFLGSLPISMLGLSELLLIQSTTGSMAQAGAVSGAVSLGNACGLIIQGRLFDRHGQTVVLVATGSTCGLALVALTVTALQRGPFPVLVALAVIAGAAIPGVITCMRILIPEMVTVREDRQTAYALLGTQFNVAMISGPLVVSGLVLVGGPSLAVLAAAGAAIIAGLIFAANQQSRKWRPSARPQDARAPHMTSILTPGVLTLLVAGFAAGVAGGMSSVAVPAVALAAGVASLAGVLFAAASIGDLIAGFVYGSRPWRLSYRLQLVVCQTGGAVVYGALTLMTGLPPAMIPLMFTHGAVQAPGGIATSAMLDDVAHPGALGQSYTIMVAAGLVGAAIGRSGGGVLSSLMPVWGLFAVAAGVTAAAALWTHLRRRSLVASGRVSP